MLGWVGDMCPDASMAELSSVSYNSWHMLGWVGHEYNIGPLYAARCKLSSMSWVS